jgi:hypothetical protein
MLGPAAFALLFFASFSFHEIAAANTPSFLNQVRVPLPPFTLTRHRVF